MLCCPADRAPLVPRHLLHALPCHCQDCSRRVKEAWHQRKYNWTLPWSVGCSLHASWLYASQYVVPQAAYQPIGPLGEAGQQLHKQTHHNPNKGPCADPCCCSVPVLQYAHYDTLPEIIARFSRYMQEVGEADQVPARGAAAAQLARL